MRTIFALLLLMALAMPAAGADTSLCAGVVDGDTITLATGETVQLIGVDAPEISTTTGAAEWYGAEAYWFVKGLVENKPVRLELGWPKKDRLDRTLAYVYLMDGTCVNAEIIVKGYGWADRGDLFRYRRRYIGYEEVAEKYNKGLWNAKAKGYFEAREKLKRENPGRYEAYLIGNYEASRRLGAFDKEPGAGHIELVKPGSGAVIYEPASEGTGTTPPAASGESDNKSNDGKGTYGIGVGGPPATASDDIVYVVNGTDTYHRGTCRLLVGDKTAIPKGEAIRRNLKPCPVCKP